MVGVDGSPIGQAALRWAVGEARARQGRIRAVHAWVSPYGWQLEVLCPVDEQTLRDAARARLDDALAGVESSGVDVEGELVEGDPGRVLVDAAGDADLLVVGSHGHRLVAEVMSGSVSTFCVHHAPVPVVVVRRARSRTGKPEAV